MIAIESGIKIPPRQSKGIANAISRLKVGQSFKLPDNASRPSVYLAADRLGITVETHKVKEDDFVGVRCWRVKARAG